jgi:hypothetical protein
MITSNAIQYTWNQIFDRLGIQIEKNLIRIGNKKVQFHYCKPKEAQLDPLYLHLIISQGDPNNFDRICDDTEFRIRKLRKSEFLPSFTIDFPVDELPILFWVASTPQNDFAEIMGGKILIFQPDLIQSIFFMLSRYEEYHLKTTDSHGRFPFHASSANRFGFIDLPLVDLYIHVLKIWLEELTGEKLPQKNKFEISLSHDVDFLSPYQPINNWIRTFAKDALRMQWRNLQADMRNIHSDYLEDPYFRGIEKLAEVSALHNLKSTFNLMAADPSGPDEGYSLDSKHFTQALQIIEGNGHQIGLHASYRSFDQPERIHEEKYRLENATGMEISTVRQHYLRIQTPHSWEAWAAAGLTKDTSYGFSEHEGFRCGTCHAYSVFDLNADRELALIEEPLIVMDATLKAYRKIPVHDGIEKINQLAKICKFVGGNFTLLWHNTSFFRDWEEWGEEYPQIIAGLVEISKS